MAIKNIKLSNGQTYSIDADVVVDPSMSDTSANAVENKVIKAYVDTGLEGKQDKTNSSLETTAKTVVGAINELKEGVDSTNAIDLTDYIGVIENISEKDFFKGKSISKTIEGNAFYNVITSYLTNSKPIEIRVQLSGMGIICIPIMCFSQETNSISLEGILNIDGIALETGMCNFFLVCSITATVDSTSITLNFANKPF